MRLQFDRWPRTTGAYESWWAGELGRPVANLFVRDSPDMIQSRLGPPPPLHYTRFTGAYANDIDPETIVDRWDYELASRRYVADGFPSIWPNFGAGALAAMTGCDLRVGEDTIWFEPTALVTAAAVTISSDVSSPIARRIAGLYSEAAKLWGGAVQLGMVDMGGVLDILQSHLPSERLLLELYDNPGEVKRLIGEVHDSWWTHFDFFRQLVAETNPGYTAWTPILSAESYYMLQCDFAYMIGPDFFDEFVLPELTASCARLERPFYHLDGQGQLVHLDKILAIPGLAGVQWIPGDGAADVRNWPEVYQKIRDAGKRIQLFVDQTESGLGALDVLAEQLGSLDSVAIVGELTAGSEEEAARQLLDRHGVPWGE